MAILVLMGGCASTPDPVARFDTRLAGYFGAQALPMANHAVSSRVGVGVVPTESSGAVAESNRLNMIATVRAALGAGTSTRSVRPIDDSYLKAGRGMDNLRQTGKLFGVDTLMLLSLDQRFRPEDSGGLVRIRTATGSRDVNLPSQTVLTYIDVVMIDLASGEAGYTRQVASELGVDARTWADPRLRRQAETDATASALEKLRLALATDFAPKKKK
ncbi:hypothetical protein [Abyssibacter sp.]|uniref:hypothetical protein n=1 Tax=Abyssibacter sp. TaxID=2320200 RepID=UPI0025C5FCA1|nr:hypothetical protein [Abyssibacter sp.]MCK5860039.1 hypothetical protein [Abyssibacter sp.]